jgi:hypothetical protein
MIASKALLVTIVLSFSLNVFAVFPNASINDFQGNYQEPSGKATASTFVVADLNFGSNPQFNVERQAASIILDANGEEFVWQNPPAQLAEINSIEWNGASLNATDDHFKLELNNFQGKTAKDTIAVRSLKLECSHSGMVGQVEEELMDSCLNFQGKINLGSFSQSKQKGSSLSRLNVSIKNNRVTFSLKSGVTIRGNGYSWYYPDQKLIKVRIDRAKAGPLNVKSRLFGELNKLSSDQIKVQNPWIEIDLNQ